MTDHLERVKLPGQAWNTLLEDDSGGSRSISLSDSAATLSKSQVFDSRGVGSIGLYTDVDQIGPDSVQTLVFTRKTGKPWMYVPTFEISINMILPSLTTLWPLTGFGNAEWIDAYIGLLDESVVVVQPQTSSGDVAASGDTGDSSVTFTAAGQLGIGGDFGNDFSVTLVDPGANDSPLSISSPDGYNFVISLATDGGGAITTDSDGVVELVTGSAGPGNAQQAWVLAAALNTPSQTMVAETIALTGGDGNATAATYTVTGTY